MPAALLTWMHLFLCNPQVGVYAFRQDVQHSGWEGLTLHFRHTVYPSHFVVEGE